MKVFRLESKDGIGLYQCKCMFSDSTSDAARHPAPWQDSLLVQNIEKYNEYNKRMSEFFYGFVSTEQLLCWVYKNEWLIDMSKNGIVLSIYEVPDEYVLVGNTQAMFFREKATGKESHNICEFFGLTEST